MYELIIDTCNDTLNVVLTVNNEYAANKTVGSRKKHSEMLLGIIDGILSENGLTIKDIDCFCCVVGAGSFTGIRVGISTVKAFCFALNKQCKSITSLQALAYNIDSRRHIVLCDANQNKFYFQAFDGYEPKCDIEVVELCELKNKLSEYKDYKLHSNIKIDGIDCNVINDNTKGLIVACGKAKAIDAKFLSPHYVRKSQAEENLL